MQATLTPKGNLYYARKYEVRLTNAITDSFDNANGSRMNLPSYSSFFTTKVPKAYDLATDQQFIGGRDIALYTFDAEDDGSITYAYVLAGDKGWRIVDVTDPTAPSVIHTASPTCNTATDSSCRRTSTEFSYRSVAIDPDKKSMAITENIVFADGNQYGYVRFYDLSDTPGFPPTIGREKLAEAMSGIPGRVALMNDKAYVATINAGLQVVDVTAAKEYQSNGKSTDGSTIVGVYDSVGEGYGQPNDIITYSAAKALLTTTSGNLLLLDINLPVPQLMAKYSETPEHILRTGVAADYSYLDQYGNQQVGDIAVVGTMEGRVLTINLTEPYNPKYIATVKGKDGNDLKTAVREISVSKESGLAFITTINSVQVIDIKDPNNPRLIADIVSLPDSGGSTDINGLPIMIPIGETPAIVEKGGWVFLANSTKGFRTLDLDPFEIIVWSESGEKMIDELSYGDGVDSDKKYHLELKFDDPTIQCNDEYLEGTIGVRKGPTYTQLILDPKAKPFPTRYDLTFELSEDGKKCLASLVEPVTNIVKKDFIISNLPESDILKDGADLTYTAVLFGGFGNKVVVDIRESGKRTLTQKGFKIEKPIFMAMDGNRDGKIDFKNPEDAEYKFWVNDDHDVISGGEEDDSNSTTKDSDDDSINTLRDLEDFARLHIKVNKHIAILPNVTYYLKFKNATNSPAINIFEGVDETVNYLTKKLSSEKQLVKTRQATIDSLTEVELPKYLIKDKDKVSPFIFEGKQVGKGALTLIVKADGVTVFEKPVTLQIEPITYFYDMYTVKNTGSNAEPIIPPVYTDMQKGPYKPIDDKAYLLYVHGWNMQDYEKKRWIETIFKRLWWQGYTGRVGSFSWPTLTEAQTSVLGYNFKWTTNYPRSENIAWNSAEALKNLLEQDLFKHKGQIRLLAHSMGTVVAGEAISKLSGNGIVQRYIVTQGAISTNYYNTNVWTDRTFTIPNISGYYASGDPYSGDKPYLAESFDKTIFLNYYNVDDYALRIWRLGNTLKPDTPYSYSGNADKYVQGEDQFFDLLSGEKKLPADRYEIFSRILQSRYFALGAVADVDKFSQFNLKNKCRYDKKHYSHSKQFRSNIVDEKCYWEKLTNDFGLPKTTE